jgi:hypothetical protein
LAFFPDIGLTIEDYLKQRDAAQDLLWPTVPVLPGNILASFEHFAGLNVINIA